MVKKNSGLDHRIVDILPPSMHSPQQINGLILNRDHGGGCRPSFALPRRNEGSIPIVCATFLTMFHLSRPYYNVFCVKYGFTSAHTYAEHSPSSNTTNPIHNHLEIYTSPHTGRFKRNNCNDHHTHCQKNNRNNTHHCRRLSIQYLNCIQT